MQRMLMGLLGLLGFGVAVFALLCALLYFTQERSVFFPGPNDPQLRQRLQANRVEIASVGAMLEGWWIENPRATNPDVILYFGGNAEDVLYTASTFSSLNASRMLVVNYRGYGGSTGKPGQEALYEDGLAIYDYAIAHGVAAERIVVMGRSLGSGVAAMLAASRPVSAAVLITPFDSLAEVAAQHYPIFPVRLLLRHPFPSIDWARQSHAPALLIAAADDNIVPSIHAQRLFEAWAAEKQLHILPGVGHNDVETHPDYYRLIDAFLLAHSINRDDANAAGADSRAAPP